MKKNVFYLFALVCAMCLFASCGNDDENNDDKKINPFGTYSGNLSVVLTIGDVPQEPIESKESVQLVKGSSDTNFSFLLKNFMLQMGPTTVVGVGNINIENVDLVPAGDNKFTFSKEIPKMKITAGDKEGITWIGPGLGEIPMTLNGTIEGDKVTVVISIPDFTGMDIAVSFTGTK